jgi:NitT/TauT family transport system permease protein
MTSRGFHGPTAPSGRDEFAVQADAQTSPGSYDQIWSRVNAAWPTVAVTAVLLVAVEIASHFAPSYIMPSLTEIAAALWGLLSNDYLHVVATLLRLLVAMAFSLAFGALLGLAMGLWSRLEPYMRAAIFINTGIPALSWILLAVFWFKSVETRLFFILAVILIPFYALAVFEAIRAFNKDLVDMLLSFRPTKWQLVRHLFIPQLIPVLFVTTRSLIGYAIRMVIFAELVAAASGVGSRMGLAQGTYRMDQLLAWTVLLVLVNILIQVLIDAAERPYLKWRPQVRVR